MQDDAVVIWEHQRADYTMQSAAISSREKPLNMILLIIIIGKAYSPIHSNGLCGRTKHKPIYVANILFLFGINDLDMH